MPFTMVFYLYRGGQCTYLCFPGVIFTSTPHNILSKPLAAFPHSHCPDNGEREMNPVAMIIISPGKEYNGLAGDGTSDLQFSSPQRYPLRYRAQCCDQRRNIQGLLH